MILLKFDNSKYTIQSGKNKLSDYFDIRVGLIKDKFNLIKDNINIEFITISNFKGVPGKETIYDKENPFGLVNYENLNEFCFTEIEEKHTVHKKKLEIPEDRILTKNDFLINTRGFPFGFSLYHSKVEDEVSRKYVATSHFIQVRPRMLNNVYVPYMHLVLNIIIKHIIHDSFKKKIIDKSSYKTISSCKIQELKELNVKLESDIEIQKSIVENYKSEYKKLQNHYLSLINHEKSIFNSIGL